MRIRLKGINSVRKTLADGSVKVFYYAWKSGPPLQGEPGSPEFIASYNEAVARKVVSPSGVLLSLLQQFQASQDFTDLADSTRRSYIALIKRIEKKFSDFPLSALKHAPAHLHLALLAGLWTGQRQGDLLRLPWSAYDGTHIRLRQSKTGARVSTKSGAR